VSIRRRVEQSQITTNSLGLEQEWQKKRWIMQATSDQEFDRALKLAQICFVRAKA